MIRDADQHSVLRELPTLVSRFARRELTRSEFSATGLLGPGGRAAEARRAS
ncbi:hypothetical protein [Streptomyces sp. NPDC060366]|uniref:hypothetical protein n=1 Tax=Streptomyces sp. NPDC060366 TaxID=3347105 RepID=UPI0036697DFE